MKTILSIAFATMFSAQALASVCTLTDVTIEGVAADSCVGMIEGNFNSLADVNNITSGSYDVESSDALFGDGIFSFSDTIGNSVAVALKQNTTWAVFTFDLSTRSTGGDGVWNGTWNTNNLSWDGKPLVRGCQGCGGLSHGMVVGMDVSQVPIPGTLSLLGIGLIGLGAVRRRIG